MSKYHYDKKFNKVLSASIVFFVFMALISSLGFAVLAFIVYWAVYNGAKRAKGTKK